MKTVRAFSLSFIVLSIALLFAEENAFPANHVIVTNLATDDVRGAIQQGGLVTFACDGVLVFSNQIQITNDVNLDASGHAITLSGGNSNRIFSIAPGTTLTLTNLTLTNGRSTNGGAIYNAGTVFAQGCRFTTNWAIGTNGANGTNGLNGVVSGNTSLVTAGTPGENGKPGQDVAGGAIYNSGTVTIAGGMFQDNRTVGGKGGKGGNGGRGGYNTGGAGGGKSGGDAGFPGAAGNAIGGSISSLGTLLLNGCVFSNSLAAGGEGGVGGTGGDQGYAFALPGFSCTNGLSTTGAVGGTVRGGAVFSSGTSSISNCVFALNAGTAGLGGTGAIFYSGSATAATLPGGKGGLAEGGAVYASSNAIIVDSTFAINHAIGGNGGNGGWWLMNGDGSPSYGAVGGADGGDASGGGFKAGNDCLVARCLLINNSVVGGTGGRADRSPILYSGNGGHAFGGGICTATNGAIVNCTIVTNNATGGTGGLGSVSDPNGARGGKGGNGYGGALFNSASNAAINLTLDHNAAIRGAAATNGFFPSQNGIFGNSYGGSIAGTGGVFQILNTILSGGTSNNAWGTITDLGHNISSDATPVWTSGTSSNNTDPLLLPLANNGGPTLTMALGVGSPALDTADCSAAPATDQRGVARPSGPGCDIGAYERAEVFTLQIWRENAATNVIRHAAYLGHTYRLVKSVDLNAWTPAVTNIAPAGGWLEFHVPATGSPCFYRVLAQ